jgi:hypothetical protein
LGIRKYLEVDQPGRGDLVLHTLKKLCFADPFVRPFHVDAVIRFKMVEKWVSRRVWGDAPAAPGGLDMGVAYKLGLDLVCKRGQSESFVVCMSP